jgi:hypothetical protein
VPSLIMDHENGKPNQDVTFFAPYRFSPGV